MGAVTVAFVKRQTMGGTARTAIVDITFSGSYSAGGDTWTPSLFGMTTINSINPMGAAVASASTGYSVAVDYTNKKLMLLGGAASGAALTETGTAGQTGTVVRCAVTGDAPYI